MAKGSIMIQIAVEQILSPAVNYAPEIWAVAFESLDGDRTTVRELATGAATRSTNLASFTSHTLLSRIYGWLFLISADRQQSCTRRLMSRRRLLTVLVSRCCAFGTTASVSTRPPNSFLDDASDRTPIWTRMCRPETPNEIFRRLAEGA